MRRTLVVLAAALAACGSATVTTTSGPSPTTIPVAGVFDAVYSITRIFVAGGEVPVVEGSSPSITFAGTDVNGTTGCNSFFGTFLVEGGTIGFGQLGQTEIGCEAPLADQEQRILAILATADRWTFDDGILTIGATDGSGALELGPGEGPAANASIDVEPRRLDEGDVETQGVAVSTVGLAYPTG